MILYYVELKNTEYDSDTNVIGIFDTLENAIAEINYYHESDGIIKTFYNVWKTDLNNPDATVWIGEY